MNKIKLAFGFFAGLLMYSCADKDEALLYDTFDFVEIKGDSVISREGLEMVASVVDIATDSIDDKPYTYSMLNSQVTVGNNVFDLYMFIDGYAAGKYQMVRDNNSKLDQIGYIKYRSMLQDSTFTTDYYAIQKSMVVWEDVTNKEVLLNVAVDARKMLNDSTFAKPTVFLQGRIRAVKN